MDKANCDYGAIPTEAWNYTIGSPARERAYHQRFHEPLIERAIERNGAPIKLVDIATGYGDALVFMKDDDRVQLTGTDISDKLLDEAKKEIPNAEFYVHDVRDSNLPYEPKSMDAATAVNAMMYSPDKMLETIFSSLKEGGEAVVNFRNMGHPVNQRKLKQYVDSGATLYHHLVNFGGESVRAVLVDFTTAENPDLQLLDKQVFFNNVIDIKRLLESGFNVQDYQIYTQGISAANVWDVVTLQKRKHAL